MPQVISFRANYVRFLGGAAEFCRGTHAWLRQGKGSPGWQLLPDCASHLFQHGSLILSFQHHCFPQNSHALYGLPGLLTPLTLSLHSSCSTVLTMRSGLSSRAPRLRISSPPRASKKVCTDSSTDCMCASKNEWRETTKARMTSHIHVNDLRVHPYGTDVGAAEQHA